MWKSSIGASIALGVGVGAAIGASTGNLVMGVGLGLMFGILPRYRGSQEPELTAYETCNSLLTDHQGGGACWRRADVHRKDYLSVLHFFGVG